MTAAARTAGAPRVSVIMNCLNGEKYLRWMPVDVFNAQNEVVARVRKQIYVRLKPDARSKASN